MQTIELKPIYTKELTPKEFLKMYQTELSEIRSARVIPSKLGDENFGKIIVEVKTPVYISELLKSKKRK